MRALELAATVAQKVIETVHAHVVVHVDRIFEVVEALEGIDVVEIVCGIHVTEIVEMTHVCDLVNTKNHIRL